MGKLTTTARGLEIKEQLIQFKSGASPFAVIVFLELKHTRNTKPSAPLLKPVQCRTHRYARLSLPLMTQLHSWHATPPVHLAELGLKPRIFCYFYLSSPREERDS